MKKSGERKKIFDLIFEHRKTHAFVCGKRKGKIKIKAQCRMFDW